jgi:hypothetical protein
MSDLLYYVVATLVALSLQNQRLHLPWRAVPGKSLLQQANLQQDIALHFAKLRRGFFGAPPRDQVTEKIRDIP